MVITCTTTFDIKKIYATSTECLYVFYKTLITNSDYLSIQCSLDWLLELRESVFTARYVLNLDL